MSKTLANELDKLIEDTNIYNKGQSKTQKELNKENEILRQCIESELEDIEVEGTEITVTDAANYIAKMEISGNTMQASADLNSPQPIHVFTGNNIIHIQGKNLYRYLGYDTNILQVRDDKYVLFGIPNTSWFHEDIGINPFNLKTNTNYRLTIYAKGDVPSLKFTLSISGNKNGVWLNTETGSGSAIITTPNTISSTDLILEGLQANLPYNAHLFVQIEEINEELEEPSYVPYYNVDFPLNVGDIEMCKLSNIEDVFFKNEPNNLNYDSTLLENGWYMTSHYKTVINNANNFERIPCENDNTKFYYRMTLLGDIQFINFNYTQTGLINYGKVNVAARQTARGMYEGFNLGGAKLFLYTDEDSALTLNQFKEKWNAKLSSIPLVIYALTNTAIPTMILDETLISQLDALYEHFKLTKGVNNITVTAEDLTPNMKLTYKKSIQSQINELRELIMDNS